MKIRSKEAYNSVTSYFKAMTRFGCTVEAVPNEILGQPRVDILIQPDGNTRVEATFDVTYVVFENVNSKMTMIYNSITKKTGTARHALSLQLRFHNKAFQI